MTVTAKIKRYDPESDEEPRWASYEVPAGPTDRALDVLNHIKWHVDGSLAVRKSCGHGVCGSDAMKINGENRLACQTMIEDLVGDGGGTIRFEPLPAMPVIKDLVVDQSGLFAKNRAVKPWLITDDPPPERERRQSPEEHELIEEASKCIMCGACTSSCPSRWADPDAGSDGIDASLRVVYYTRRGPSVGGSTPLRDGSHGIRLLSLSEVTVNAESDDSSTRQFDTRCVHAGEPLDERGGMFPPIYNHSTFGFSSTEELKRVIWGQAGGESLHPVRPKPHGAGALGNTHQKASSRG